MAPSGVINSRIRCPESAPISVQPKIWSGDLAGSYRKLGISSRSELPSLLVQRPVTV